MRAELAVVPSEFRDIPIVVVTGERIDALDPPVSCLLQKPVLPEQLVLVVHALAGLLASILIFPQSPNRLLSMPTLTALGAVVAAGVWWSRPRWAE